MTKIKNTKKGMAKKTLSMSLVVAMLATSNVPVWAAEFSDGSDVAVTSEVAEDTEAFSDETVDAPVVDDAAEEVSTAQVAADYSLNTNMELKSGTWKDKVTLAKKDGVTDAAKFEISKNGVPVETSKIKYEVYYNDDINVTATALPTVSDSMELTSTAPGLDAFTGGKKVTVKFYVDGEKEAVATFETQLKAVDLSNATIDYTTPYQNYNGNIQRPASNELTVKLSGETVNSENYVVKFENAEEAKDYKVGGYKFAVEGIKDKGYTGTSKYDGTFTIGRLDANKDNLSVVVSGTTTYNGTENTVPTVVVTDKLSKKVIPSELYTVTVDTDKNKTDNQVDKGDYKAENITVTMKESATINGVETYNNFKAVAVNPECVTGTFSIAALDLSKLGEKYTVQVKPQEVSSTAKELNWNQIILTDKSTGKVVEDISKVLPTNELTPVLTNNATAGKGRLTIKVKSALNQNIINEYVTDVSVANNVINKEDIALPKGTKLTSNSTALTAKTALSDTTLDKNIKDALNASVYTGSALEPLKAVFENIVWSGSTPSGTDMKFTLGKDYTITYTNNTDSDVVKGANKDASKKATVTLQFMGDYVGSVSYTFDIAQATAYVSGEKISYTAGKNSYDANVKVVTKSGSTETAVPTTEYTVKTKTKARKIGDKAIADVVFTNPNYKINYNKADLTDVNADKCAYVQNVESELVGKSLTDSTVTATVDGTYTYTGKEITPTITVKDGSTELKLGTDYKIVAKNGTEAGDAYVTIEGINNYSGKLTLKYTISKADLANATVESSKTDKTKKNNYDQSYDGLAQKPDIAVENGKVVGVKIGDTVLAEYDPITKTGDFELTWDLDAVEVGTYNFTITAVASSKKVQGTFKGTYKVIPSELHTHFAKKSDANSKEINTLTAKETGAYYTGKAITVADFKTKVVVYDTDDKKVLTEGKDYRLEYSDNIDAGLATVKAYGLGNHAYKDENGKEVAIATLTFNIEGKGIIAESWVKKISDTEYAGGLPVEPEVVVADANGNRLIQGVDYTVETDAYDVYDAYDGYNVFIKGKGAYVAADEDNDGFRAFNYTKEWKITKKDLANTTITVDKNNNVTVINGSVIVPSSEYDVKFSEDGKTVTVTAKADSKNYTGSKELSAEVAKVGAPMISDVKVVGNKATVILSGDAEGASGYDYVISTDRDCITNKDYDSISKNQVQTSTTFKYVNKGVYYAYCHAWTRDENGKKVFGEWSNAYPFSVTAITPDAPVITNVKVSGSTIKVTYKAAANATGYDVVLGTDSKKENGETRPYHYGNYKKLNLKEGTVTATFKNVPKGTWVVGMHAFNRTSEDGKKVFSPWSNLKKATVK